MLVLLEVDLVVVPLEVDLGVGLVVVLLVVDFEVD